MGGFGPSCSIRSRCFCCAMLKRSCWSRLSPLWRCAIPLTISHVSDADRPLIIICKGFTATGRPSALTTLSLHLFPEGMDFLPHNFDLLKRLLSSFTPASFPHLTQIEILSTPGTDSFALRARSLAEELVDWFPVMEDLTLFLGVGTSLLSLRYSAESLVSLCPGRGCLGVARH